MKSSHWPQHRIPVGNEWKQNRRCVTVWESRFSSLFVYVRGKMEKFALANYVYMFRCVFRRQGNGRCGILDDRTCINNLPFEANLSILGV